MPMYLSQRTPTFSVSAVDRPRVLDEEPEHVRDVLRDRRRVELPHRVGTPLLYSTQWSPCTE